MSGEFPAHLTQHSFEVDKQLDAATRVEALAVLSHIPARAEGILAEAEAGRAKALRRAKGGAEGSGAGAGDAEGKGTEGADASDVGADADASTPPPSFSGLPLDLGREDALVLATARWFKHEYFRWVDPIKCGACGGETAGGVGVEPNAMERAGGAGRVELHACTACGSGTRFPRLNRVSALMRTRVGRCGEFAQVFYIFLLALGLDARYVWNSEDHVWTEYWSPALGHWVHVDSCEAEVNKPLLYDRGWGKAQAYCLAFGPGGAEDVTRVYVDDWDACFARRLGKEDDGSGWDEDVLAALLAVHTEQCRAHMDELEAARWESMDEAQARWVSDEAGRWAEAEGQGLHGRQSGTEEWKAERGEDGHTDPSEVGDVAALPPVALDTDDTKPPGEVLNAIAADDGAKGDEGGVAAHTPA